MKVTLISPKDEWLLAGGDRPPLALPQLAAYIRQFGYDVECQDLNHQKLDVLDDPDVIGITSTTPHYSSAVKLVDEIKLQSPDSTLVLGGAHATALPDDCLKYFDLVVIGEGENALKEICDRHKKKKLMDRKVKGKYIENLDDLPFPAWDLLPMSKYSLRIGGRRAMHIVTSRGCPYNCIYCCKRIFGYKFRANSAEYLIREIIELTERYPFIQGVQFPDDTFTINRDRVVKFCNLLIKKKIDITWRINTRVNHVDKELLMLMSKAGCVTVSYGIESFDQNVLNTIRKGTTVKQNVDALKWTRQADIRANAFMMVGLPSETEDSIDKSLEYAEKYVDTALWSVLTPYPDTHIWDNADKFDIKIHKNMDWDQFRTYDMNFVPPITIDVGDLTSKEIWERAKRVRAEWGRITSARSWK